MLLHAGINRFRHPYRSWRRVDRKLALHDVKGVAAEFDTGGHENAAASAVGGHNSTIDHRRILSTVSLRCNQSHGVRSDDMPQFRLLELYFRVRGVSRRARLGRHPRVGLSRLWVGLPRGAALPPARLRPALGLLDCPARWSGKERWHPPQNAHRVALPLQQATRWAGHASGDFDVELEPNACILTPHSRRRTNSADSQLGSLN